MTLASQADHRILELELLGAAAPRHGRLGLRQELSKAVLVRRLGPVLVGGDEGGPLRGIRNDKVLGFALATGQGPADIARTVGATELAGEHGDELSPTRGSLGGVDRSGGATRPRTRDWGRVVAAGNMLQNLLAIGLFG